MPPYGLVYESVGALDLFGEESGVGVGNALRVAAGCFCGRSVRRSVCLCCCWYCCPGRGPSYHSRDSSVRDWPRPGLVPIIPELPVLVSAVLVPAILVTVVLIFAALVLLDSISTEVVVAIRVVASSGSASMVCHGC